MTKDSLKQWLEESNLRGVSAEALLEGREFSCVMAPAPSDLADAVIRWGQMFVNEEELFLDPEDPDGFGREDDIHVTVKFGLHENEPSPELLRIVEETQPFEIEIGPCTLFDKGEKYDVVKFDVDGDALREMNRRISELPNGDSHPEYHPHMTVAYVTKGTCHELIGKPLLDTQEAPDIRFLVKTVTFSSKDKTKTTLFLGKPNLKPVPDEVSESDEDDTEMDLEDAKEVHGERFKRFTWDDVEARYSDFPCIRAKPEDLIDAPDRKRQKQHDSGLGPQVGSGLKICFNGRIYRLHVWDHGDHSSVWFKANKKRISLW